MLIEGIAPAGPDRCWAAGAGGPEGQGDHARLLLADEHESKWSAAQQARQPGAPKLPLANWAHWWYCSRYRRRYLQ